jgi:hypothetical protein
MPFDSIIITTASSRSKNGTNGADVPADKIQDIFAFTGLTDEVNRSGFLKEYVTHLTTTKVGVGLRCLLRRAERPVSTVKQGRRGGHE